MRPEWPGAGTASSSHDFMHCKDCGLVQLNPMPDPRAQADFHSSHYDGAAPPERLGKMSPEHSRKRLYSAKYQKWAAGLLRDLAAHISPQRSAPLRLLEIGAASGGILKAARDLGMIPTGVEVSAEVAAIGIRELQLDIRVGLVEEMNLPSGGFDILILQDVIENVPSPASLMKESARLLAPGGVIYIHTVNVESRTAAEAGSEFFLADATGGHVVLFSPGTLARYVTTNGLRVLETTTGGYRILQRECDRAAVRGLKRRWIRLRENIGHRLVKNTLRGHFVTVIAQKS
jgi:2-polyprenyl-3-methyl-5-hydroxy-6-metoxy-1,4-benzoquinol methylase